MKGMLKFVKCPRCDSSWIEHKARVDLWRCKRCGQWMDLILPEGGQFYEAKALTGPIVPRQPHEAQTPNA